MPRNIRIQHSKVERAYIVNLSTSTLAVFKVNSSGFFKVNLYAAGAKPLTQLFDGPLEAEENRKKVAVYKAFLNNALVACLPQKAGGQ
ncbi:hypothetical protein EVAR_63861_1 [Eumeta japonica]|uniref:Uncharacterized protein n=1 Tax=Eumeta variegata TaxID=151549 RepID=A0A4C1SEG7_EUMVA|nr:hypothetical protein EVAR_63861_1 [Eumeta japonica]